MERISWVWKTLRHTSWVQWGLPDLGPGKLTTQLHHGHLQFPEGFLNPAQRSAASHSNKDKTHSWLQESLQLCKEQYSLFQMVAIRLQDSERNTLYTLKSTKSPMTSITYREQWLKLTVSLGQSVWMTQCVSTYLRSQDYLSVSRHKEGAEGVFAGHGANHLQSGSVTVGRTVRRQWPMKQELFHWMQQNESNYKTLSGPAASKLVLPVPNFDGVSGGGEDSQVVWAEGQCAHICAVSTECEASRFISYGGLVWGLQAVGLNCVILEQQNHLQLTTCTWQAVHPPERGQRTWMVCTCEQTPDSEECG